MLEMWKCEACGFPENFGELPCSNCEAPRGWEYDGPDELDYPPTAGERAEMANKQRRPQ